MEEILALHCRNYAAYLPNLVMELDSVFVVFGMCGRLYTYFLGGGRGGEGKRQCLCDRMCLGSSVGVSALGHTIKEGQSQG